MCLNYSCEVPSQNKNAKGWESNTETVCYQLFNVDHTNDLENDSKWCCIPRFCSVSRYWAGAILANEMHFAMNHAACADRSLHLLTCSPTLCYGCPYKWARIIGLTDIFACRLRPHKPHICSPLLLEQDMCLLEYKRPNEYSGGRS